MNLSVRTNAFNASYVELDGSGMVPPLLVSSFTGLCLLADFCFLCASIEHIRLYFYIW